MLLWQQVNPCPHPGPPPRAGEGSEFYGYLEIYWLVEWHVLVQASLSRIAAEIVRQVDWRFDQAILTGSGL